MTRTYTQVMDNPKPPQIKNESLGIDDTNRKTTGGPPGWMAFAIVGIFIVVAVIVLAVIFGLMA